MAFQNYMNEDDLKKDANGQPIQQASQQSTALPTSGTSSGGGDGGAPPQQTTKGAGWTNLQTYLGANAGQGAQTTQKLIDPKQQQIDTAVNSLNDDVNKTNTQIQTNTIQRNEDLEKRIQANPTAAKDEFVSYTGQTYKGPTTYAPNTDVQKAFVGVQPTLKMDELSDPKAIGGALKDNRYTYGMGALDGYLINSEGGAEVTGYNTKSADVLTNKDKRIADVNSAISSAQNTSSQNIGFAKQAAKDGYQTYLEAAKASVPKGLSDASELSYQDIVAKYKAAGLEAPTSANDYISANKDYGWMDNIDPATLAALNTLAEIDGDDSTNTVSKGGNSAVNVDWNKVNSDIQNKQFEASVAADIQKQIEKQVKINEEARKAPKVSDDQFITDVENAVKDTTDLSTDLAIEAANKTNPLNQVSNRFKIKKPW